MSIKIIDGLSRWRCIVLFWEGEGDLVCLVVLWLFFPLFFGVSKDYYFRARIFSFQSCLHDIFSEITKSLPRKKLSWLRGTQPKTRLFSDQFEEAIWCLLNCGETAYENCWHISEKNPALWTVCWVWNSWRLGMLIRLKKKIRNWEKFVPVQGTTTFL